MTYNQKFNNTHLASTQALQQRTCSAHMACFTRAVPQNYTAWLVISAYCYISNGREATYIAVLTKKKIGEGGLRQVPGRRVFREVGEVSLRKSPDESSLASHKQCTQRLSCPRKIKEIPRVQMSKDLNERN